jgi:hypothetical protein
MGRVPNNNQNFLPDIPTSKDDWFGLRRFLQGTRKAVQDNIQNPDPPDQVTGLRLSTDTGGVTLKWDPSNRATGYIIFRSFDSNSSADANAVGYIHRANDLSFFDPNGQNASATNRFYWVVPHNGPVRGPISVSVTTPEVAASTGSGTSIGNLLKNATRQRQISPIGTLDAAAAPSSTDTVNMKVTIGSAKNWPTGTRVTVSATLNGLTAGTIYYLGRFSSTIFAFYTDVQNAVDDVSKVALSGAIAATITPDAVVFCTIPTGAASAALATFRNEGTAGNWLLRTLGIAPTTSVYSAKIGPGDVTLGTLGEGFSEEDPPIGDICVFHDDPTNGSAGVLAAYAGWNDGTSPLVGPTGPTGAAGRGYKATSVSSVTIASSGSVTFVTQTNLAYTVGARIRATSSGSAAFAEGVVTAYTEFVGSANLVVTLDLASGSGAHTDWNINLAGQQGVTGATGATGSTGATGATGPAGTGGSPSTNDFRLTLSSGNPVYRPLAATPSSTNTTTDIVTFSVDPGWTDGTIVTPASTLGGLTAGTRYYIHRISSTTFSFHTTVANALAGTSKVDLTASITQQINPSGVSNTTVYLTPFTGNTTFTYVSSAWAVISSAEISFALGTLTSGKNYDVFVYSNSGVLTLELSAAWTSDILRADALAQQDGIWVKSSDHTRRYVGTIRTDSTTTTIDDAGNIISQAGGKRFVWNLYNRTRAGLGVYDGTSSWSYTTGTWRQANANTGNKVEFVLGLAIESVDSTVVACVNLASNSARHAAVSVGVDSTSVQAIPRSAGFWSSATPIQMGLTAAWNGSLGIGYHFLAWLEFGADSTSTFIGNEGGAHAQSGLVADVTN